MAAGLASKCSLVGFPSLAGFGNKGSGSLSTSRDITGSKFLSSQLSLHRTAREQLQRTFVQISTMLEVADNSGARRVMCIQVLGSKKVAKLGDTVVVTVKEAAPKGAVKKGQVLHGVVVRCAMQTSRIGGFRITFDDNAVVLLDSKAQKGKSVGQPIGSRVFGPIPEEIRKTKHAKILSLAPTVI